MLVAMLGTASQLKPDVSNQSQLEIGPPQVNDYASRH
ncbi:hypothetical protein IMCC1933_18070 [Rhodobacteraceae bacterium IMCC1933]|nr:hypothetical protein [Rhodobacteraceae bacterium IMCC1933]MDP4071521.1 hypothetical protein [Rhodobacteraceae bacterium IMCC1909]